MKKILFCLTLLLLLSGRANAETEGTTRGYIQQGNHNYLEGRYEEALKSYLKAEETLSNGYLLYNIGNCYYRLDRKGEALAYYKKAKRHIPSFQDLKANIGYIKGERTDDIADVEAFPWVKRVYFFQEALSVTELSYLALGFLGGVLLFLLLRFFLHKQQFLWAALASLFLLTIFTSSAALKYYEYTFLRFGVISVKEVEVKSERNENAVTLFKLHEATHFRVISENQDWLYLELSTDKRGWIRRSDAALI